MQILTISFVFEVAVRGEPLVHADEDDDHESVEDEPGHHEAAPPLGPRGADDGEQVHHDRRQAERRDAELSESEINVNDLHYWSN